MAVSNWQAIEELLDPAELTVRAQAVPPNDQDTLLWEDFFPRQDVDSVDLWDVTTIDYRPTADRREWNANGRLIPMPTPARRQVTIVPIEARDQLHEKEMQRVNEQAMGNAAILREILGVTIPKRTERLALSCYRRLEVDAMNAWANGNIIQKNPETGATYTASFGFPGTRYLTAGTAWNDGGVNAYDLFQAWVVAAQDLVGAVEGAMMRLATLNAILADAPNLPNTVKMTRSQLEERVQDDMGQDFYIAVNENSLDVFDDGGLTYTRTKVWPAMKVAAIPAGGVVGRSAFAPVIRAWEVATGLPGGKIDVRGVTIYPSESNNGKTLELQGQINALPIPDEQKIYVINAGV